MITSFHNQHRFLSNFSPVKVTLDGLEYPSVEHAYQAAKTNNSLERSKIRRSETPGQAKRMGRTVKMRIDWGLVKDEVMFDLLTQKFNQEPYRTQLLGTGDHQLIEGNTWGDKYWGCVYQGRLWIGQNKLGQMLMRIREKIQGD